MLHGGDVHCRIDTSAPMIFPFKGYRRNNREKEHLLGSNLEITTTNDQLVISFYIINYFVERKESRRFVKIAYR